jgi:hypothetical protein
MLGIGEVIGKFDFAKLNRKSAIRRTANKTAGQ